MRRLLVWTLATGMVLLAGGQHAVAKEGHEDPRQGATGVLSPVPKNLRPGRVWTATITFHGGGRIVEAEGFRPTVTLHETRTGQVLAVPGLHERPGVYTARIVFPQAGSWRVEVKNGFDGTIDDVTTLRINAGPSLSPSLSSFPAWAWIMSGLMSLLVVASAFLFLPRLRRKQVVAS
jgi:hypothetical protein